jgi:hypothetical protein
MVDLSPGRAAGLPATPAETADREMPPATIAPTRKAITAVSASVTNVNRFILEFPL